MITISISENNDFDIVLNCDNQHEQDCALEAVTNGLAYVCAWNRLSNHLLHLSEFNATIKADYLLRFMERVLEEEE